MKTMKTYLPTSTNQMRQEEGAVLVVALILLIVLTMLGISAIESTKLETKMAANTTNYNRAFQTAEAGLDQAIDDYTAPNNLDAFDNITPEGNCETEETALSVTDKYGNKLSHAFRCIKESGTTKTITTGGGGITRRYYIVQSTGRSHVTENHSLETKIVSAVGVDAPGTYVLEQNF